MHDSSGVPALLQYLILFGAGTLVGHLHERLVRVPPKASKLQSLREPPGRSFHEAFWQARHDEVVRLAHTHEPTTVPGLIRSDVADRPIVSLPVYLYESRPARWLYRVRVAYSTRAQPCHTSAGTKRTLSPVDHGTLHLTRRQFIFSSSTRQREFPLDALTHLAATKSSIALATLSDGAISYFKGIPATNIIFEVVPGATDPWPHVHCTFDFTGYEVKEIVRLLLFPSPSSA